MTAPIRLRLSRKAGFNLQLLSLATNGLPAVSVARPGRWGNPHVALRTWYHGGYPSLNIPPFEAVTAADADREGARVAVALFRQEAERRPEAFAELRGKNLACWCALDAPWCHADVELELANRPVCEDAAASPNSRTRPMQISDAQGKTAKITLCAKCSMPIGDSALYIGGRIYHHECSPFLSALSLPVQPVAWPEPKFVPMGGSGMRLNPERVAMLRREINAELVLGEQIQLFSALGLSDYIEPSTTPPVPPTKGPEDDLIAAREAAEDIEINYVVCDPKEVREQVAAAIVDALRKDRALRSRPASALPVVEIDRFNGIIERIENRCLAAEGPVTPTMSEISDSELAEVWQLLQSIRSALTPSVQP